MVIIMFNSELCFLRWSEWEDMLERFLWKDIVGVLFERMVFICCLLLIILICFKVVFVFDFIKKGII